jgi:hypothetical protein
MEPLTRERNDLMEIIKDFPENKLSELLDFAQFLKQKKQTEELIDLSSLTGKIIEEDKKLLKRLAE